MPELGFGSASISANTRSTYTLMKSVIKKILKRNIKQIKKDYSLYKIIKQMPSFEKNNLIDTSRAYGASEFVIGKAMKKRRDDFFIVTKISNKAQYEGRLEEEIETSLKQLNTDYIDLYLMHWPVNEKYLETWKTMEKMYQKGLCKAIGVCNCDIHHLKEIEKIATIKPMVNQIECHPLLTQNKLREYCKENKIQVLAYTPTARNDERLYKTVLVPIAKKYHKSVIQIILRWHIQLGNIPIVNSSSMKHYKENQEIFDFTLNEEEIEQILAININSRLRYDSNNCDFRQL